MTPKEINTAVAEWMGWKYVNEDGPNWIKPGQSNPSEFIQDLPRYHSNLNAIAEAVNALSPEQKTRWLFILKNEVLPQTRHTGLLSQRQGESTLTKIMSYEEFDLANATAPQRSTALVKVIGRWKDEPVKGEK